MTESLGKAVLELSTANAGLSQGLGHAKEEVSAAMSTMEGAVEHFGLLHLLTFAGIAETLKKVTELWGEQEQAERRLSTALVQTGQYSRDTAEKFIAFADHLQETTGAANELIVRSGALLLNLGVMPSQLQRAATAATDLSAALGLDLETAMRLVGRAASGHTELFARYGITLDQAAVAARGFDYVLEEFERRFGGQARLNFETMNGALQSVSNSFADIGKQLGRLGSYIVTYAAKDIAEGNKSLEELLKTANDLLGVTPDLTSKMQGMSEGIRRAGVEARAMEQAMANLPGDARRFFEAINQGKLPIEAAIMEQEKLNKQMADFGVEIMKNKTPLDGMKETIEAISKEKYPDLRKALEQTAKEMENTGKAVADFDEIIFESGEQLESSMREANRSQLELQIAFAESQGRMRDASRLRLQAELLDLEEKGRSAAYIESYKNARLLQLAREEDLEEQRIRDDAMKRFEDETGERIRLGEELRRFAVEGERNANRELMMLTGAYTEWVKSQKERELEDLEAKLGASLSTTRLYNEGLMRATADAQAEIQAAYGNTTAWVEVQVRRRYEAVLAATKDEVAATAAAEAEKLRLSQNFFDGVTQGLIDLRIKTQNYADLSKTFIIDAYTTIQRSLSDTFFDVLKGNFKDMEKVVSRFGDAMIRSFADLAAKLTVNSAFQFLTNTGGANMTSVFSSMTNMVSSLFNGLFGGGPAGGQTTGGGSPFGGMMNLFGTLFGGGGGLLTMLAGGGLGALLVTLFGKDNKDPFKGTNQSQNNIASILAAELQRGSHAATNPAVLQALINQIAALAGSDNPNKYASILSQVPLSQSLAEFFLTKEQIAGLGGLRDPNAPRDPTEYLAAMNNYQAAANDWLKAILDALRAGAGADLTVNVQGADLGSPAGIRDTVSLIIREIRSQLLELEARTV